MKFLPKIKKFLINFTIIMVLSFLLFEVLYRYSVIDFYKAETSHLNSEADLANTSVDFLVFGDSFSATAKEINYIDKLRANNPNTSFVNVSVPGIGIRQVNTFASSKIKKHNPKAIMYQIYVGNDLTDVDHLWSWEKFSITRNLYWAVSDCFLSLSYLNHKASMFSPRVNSRTYTMATDVFSEEYYDQRTKRFLNFDAGYFNNTLMLKDPFASRYDAWLAEMHHFLETIPKDIPVYLVWIPHCSQVNSYYMSNLNRLGATFEDEVAIQQSEYPFFAKATKDLNAYTNVIQVNPLSVFQVNDTFDHRLYFANDPHINDQGNVVLSDFLQSELPLE
ncbi:hypothetical protein [uncultured Kordia sp.]|uniref:hypothetical protein n=1 Tax=uncultured Kordia sp. TaxID=507699 RepID=UPI0026318547|nr:hypothetical protein [uncultured Kordia sp.]